jgi:hypothetical protein
MAKEDLFFDASAFLLWQRGSGENILAQMFISPLFVFLGISHGRGPGLLVREQPGNYCVTGCQRRQGGEIRARTWHLSSKKHLLAKPGSNERMFRVEKLAGFASCFVLVYQCRRDGSAPGSLRRYSTYIR